MTPVTQRLRSIETSRRQREVWVWQVAIALFVVGDIALTAMGLHLGAVEKNPAALQLIHSVGLFPAMIGAKSLVLVWVWGCWSLAPQRYRVALPAVLALFGLVIVCINSYVVLVSAGVL